MLRHVPRRGKTQAVAEAHHQQRNLTVELAFRSPRCPCQMGQPSVEFRFGGPQAFVELFDRTVRAVDEHEIEPWRYHVLDRLVHQDQLDRAKTDRQRQHPLHQSVLIVSRQPHTSVGETFGIDALQLAAQHLVRQSLLTANRQRRFAHLHPCRRVRFEGVLNRGGQGHQHRRIDRSHRRPSTSTA